LAANCFKPCDKDSLAVELLRKEGAIFFARSNVPQLMSVIETVNLIWGRASNPWNLTRSTGGSSGGEAGLISTGCSPIGMGTDGLGSLRVPSLWCGIYTFKATSGRLSWKHSIRQLNYFAESKWSVLYPSIGPMGRSVDDIILLTKCLASKENRDKDPHYPFLEWSDKATQITKRLKIGYVVSEEMFGSCKTVRRAVLEAVEELKRQNHEVEEIKIPNFNSMIRIALALMTSDGKNKGNLLALEGEQLIDEMRIRAFLLFIPRWVRRLFLPSIKAFLEERGAYLGNWTAGLSGDQWLWILHEKEQIEKEFFSFWKEKEFDAIVTPGSGLPALPHGKSGELALNCCYLWIANMLNLPAGIVPVTHVRKGEDNYDEKDSSCGGLIYKQSVEAMKGSQGLPVGVQILTLPFEDEKCLGVMKLLEEKFPVTIKTEIDMQSGKNDY
jgi:Asp-tRNA(Asn)/Glu-tRNA(Gln) amidotransferase A subunit family amidase